MSVEWVILDIGGEKFHAKESNPSNIHNLYIDHFLEENIPWVSRHSAW